MDFTAWSGGLEESLLQVWQIVLANLPKFLFAALVLGLGWLVARACRALMAKLIARLGRIASGRAVERDLRDSGAERFAVRAVGGVVFWAVLLIFAAVAVEILGLQALTSGVNRLVQYLPRIAAAVVVVLAGIVLGRVVRRTLARAAASAGWSQGELLGQAARTALLVAAGVIALDQVGIESTLLILVVVVLLATVVGGVALAFGLGARETVEGLLAAHYAGRRYREGDRVRVGGIEGRIVEFTTTSVVIETEEGRALVPATEFGRGISVLLTDRG